jgi:hypothetical protein
MSDFRGFSFYKIACLKSDINGYLRQLDYAERNDITKKRHWSPERIAEVFSDSSLQILSRKRNALPTIVKVAYDVLTEQRFAIVEQESVEGAVLLLPSRKQLKSVHVKYGIVSKGLRLVCRARVWVCRVTCQRRMDSIEFELCRALRHNNVAAINAWDAACQQERDKLQPAYERALHIVKLVQQLIGELQRLEKVMNFI